MDIAGIAIQKKTVTLVLTAALAVGGLFSFFGLGQLEDPEFTIKDALVITPYPGASAIERMHLAIYNLANACGSTVPLSAQIQLSSHLTDRTTYSWEQIKPTYDKVRETWSTYEAPYRITL